MISSSTSLYKLKSSKSCRDVPDTDYSHSDESGDHEIIDRYSNYSRDRGYRGSASNRSRTRSTEFRPSRGGTASSRSGFRGRRGDSTRRSDREYSDNYYGSRKYENSRNDTSGGYRGKCYEPEKKSDIKLSLPEDTRISKLLRRLNNETNQDNSLQISKKLLEVLLLADNAPYIRKAFHILGESMYEILHVSPGLLAKQQAARALGRMGYIMGQEGDFDRYCTWLFMKKKDSNEKMQILLMSTFKETFHMEMKKPILEEYIPLVINNLVTSIEMTENAEVFKAILEILVLVVEMYPNEFYTQFRDTIDLLFGWHVDHTQPLSIVEFISKSLQKLSNHFRCNMNFSISLVENFLEDITNLGSELNSPETLDHVTVLILALNTVLKCLGTNFHPINSSSVTTEFIVNCLVTIIKTVGDALDNFVHENLVIAANDCISLLLSYLDTKPQTLCNSIYNLIDLELTLFNDFSDNTVICVLLLIAKVVKELSTNLPVELIEKLIGPKSDIVKLRSSPYSNIQNAVICIYQALLNLKNVSLLQEAYRYVLGDLERFYKKIVSDFQGVVQNNPFKDEEGDEELAIMFLLRCLSQLANASSIIVMWALKPSILELVGVNLRPHDPILAKKSPHIQFSLLYLLFAHCKCYNHFISNSSLVSSKQEINRFALTEGLNINDVPSTSPNSGNFAVILDVLYRTLKVETSPEVTLLLLQWLNDILINSDSYLEAFYLNEKFALVTDVLVKCGYHFNVRIIQAVSDNLEKLLSNKQLAWSNIFLTNVCDLCKLHMTSNHPVIRERYSKLSSSIPWDVAVVEINKINNVTSFRQKPCNSKSFNSYMIYLAQSLHLNGSVDGEMYPEQFKKFMEYLLNKGKNENGFLEEIFTSCWTQDSESQMNMELFYDLAMGSRQVLSDWCTLEAAQYCVNYKLRTPLGKPIETFTKFDSALIQLGNDLVMMKRTNDRLNEKDGNRVRMLLHFIEHLSKSIYNASEGCAIAMPQPNKTVRSFFIANTNTCNEWLSRISMVVMHIALHCGESGIALKHGQNALYDLVAQEKSLSAEFERVAMFVTLALLNLKEPEALYGLYTWCKMQTGKRFMWIRCAAEQSSRKYELAADGYKKILEESLLEKEEKKLDQDVYNFIQDQVVLCYKESNNWKELFKWKESNQVNISENGKKYWFNTTDWECNKNLYDFETDNHAFIELSTWQIKEEDSTWSLYENLTTSETNLYNIALSLALGSDDLTDKINNSIDTIQKNLQDLLPLAPSEFLQNYSLLQYVATGLKHVAGSAPAHTVFLVSEYFENEIEKVDTSVLRKILWWSEYFAKVQNQGFNIFSSNLRLDIIKRARKEKNLNLATRHIFKFFKDKGVEFASESMSSFNMEIVSDINLWTLDTARAMCEVIKICYASEDTRQTAFNLCASVSTVISKYAELYSSLEHRKISSKILLKLAGWLQNNENVNIAEMNSPLGKLVMVLPEIGMLETTTTNIIPLNEMAIGKLLQFSVQQCVGLAKSWNAFGTWCYRWGKKIVDHSSDIKNKLSEEHCVEIRALLPFETPEEDFTKIFLILSQTRAIIDEEDIDSNEINTSDMIQAQLQTVGALKNASEEQLRSLVQIWKNTQKRIYNYYALSAEAYFKYLHLVTGTDNYSRSTECTTITVTLRLLRLIVKYALELQNILEEGLQKTPTQPWKVIIPQLFSRLNHPENYVRYRVSDLLCRVAEDAPQLITFPAVVGALEGGVKFEFGDIKLPKDCLSQNNDDIEENDLENEEDNYESDNDEGVDNSLQACFKTMVDTLSKQDPETISQVQTLVKELRRITLLWDELWLGTLAQHQSEISKRQYQLEYEIEKVNENINLTKEEKSSLIAEKHRIIIKPIIFVLEQLNDVTSVEPETPHEKYFQEKYMADIKDVIEKLKNPDHPEKPQESLSPLKQLQKKFQQKFHKRASYTLKMQDISPVLHSIKETLIAMPGLATSKKNVTISHVSNAVSILPTKTKPKKLVFYGSDGHTYTYLFKGLEDLHLDERIMQFLSIANTMMAQNADPAGHNYYRARHYSVIPLGPRSGLISWVDGTTPIFALYKRWQQRELAKPNVKVSSNVNTTVPRPSELFYNKLIEHGVKNIDNRKEWQLSVLKEVLSELMAETPSDLLSKELWCNSVSANSWWQVVKRYSYSLAVMSIIGYIIGLGDRHLDNMLIDLTTGDVVHIDYNVCFEKGKTLRVPEKVPFRLTPNIRDALGVTGVEGIFRLASENVMKIMRKGRETLLTLLEAFVYDPLIDWTVGGEVLAGTTFGGGAKSAEANRRQSKKELEREVTLAMFDVRCTEMKIEWQENKVEILNEIPGLKDNFKSCLALNEEIEKVEDELQDLHQQLALVKEAEAQGPKKHSLFKLPSLYDNYVKSQDAVNTAKKGLCDFIKECNSHSKAFNSIFTSYEKQFNQWLKFAMPDDSMHIFDLVKEFLHNAGKDDVISECEQSEIEVFRLAQSLNCQTRKCIQIAQEYMSLLIQCPKSYLENHRTNLYAEWANYLLETKTTGACDIVFEKIRSFLEIKSQNNPHILKVALTLDTFYKDTLLQVNKLFDELATIRTKDPPTTLEKLYGNAKLNIVSFLSQEKGAESALKFVLSGALLILNRTFLTLEIAAHRSGDWLIKLTSRDGDWFLDDLLLHSMKAVEVVNNVPLKQDTDDMRFYQIINGIKIAHAIYKGLYDLNFNFHTIILPETMKKIQGDDETVLSMINKLNAVIIQADIPLPEMVTQLEKLLTCVLMHVDVHTTYDLVLEKVSETKKRFLDLIPTQSDSLSHGKMLLMGFNGLFEKINQEINNLVSILGGLDIPKSWKKLDHVKDAKNISPHIFNPKIRALLESIFFLKRIMAITDFFALAQEMCANIQGTRQTVIYTDEQLTKPVKQYIADFISRQLLGVTPEAITYAICCILQDLHLDVTHEIEQKDIGAESKVPLDELYHKAYNVLIKDGAFTANVVSQASSLEMNLKTAWDKIQEPKKIEQKLSVLQSSAYRLQSQIAVHNLMFNDVLLLTNLKSVRSKFLLEMQTELTGLRVTYKQLIDSKEKQEKLVDKAYQRLNWAKGANPNVVEILAAFQTAVKSRDTSLTIEQKIVDNVLTSCNVILQHELLRTNTVDPTKEFDKLFLSSFEKWRIACQYSESKSENLQPAEERILNMLTLDMVKDPKWLLQLSGLITEIITICQKTLSDKKNEMFLKTDTLAALMGNFKNLYNNHTKLMQDVKSLLKIMSKIEDYSVATQAFIQSYKKYVEHFGALFNVFKDHSVNKNVIEDVMQHLEYINEQTEDIYEGVLALQEQKGSSARSSLRRQSCVIAEDQDRTENKVQPRNGYAVNVWRRVKMKLEGRDPDPGRKCTAQEQVDYVIREATSLENLALLYEGWTPWV